MRGGDVKQLRIRTSAEASLVEHWVLTVPDDFDPEDILDVLDHPEDFGAAIESVFDETDNEHDREVLGWDLA